jgi:hypothetical protein
MKKNSVLLLLLCVTISHTVQCKYFGAISAKNLPALSLPSARSVCAVLTSPKTAVAATAAAILGLFAKSYHTHKQRLIERQVTYKELLEGVQELQLIGEFDNGNFNVTTSNIANKSKKKIFECIIASKWDDEITPILYPKYSNDELIPLDQVTRDKRFTQVQTLLIQHIASTYSNDNIAVEVQDDGKVQAVPKQNITTLSVLKAMWNSLYSVFA